MKQALQMHNSYEIIIINQYIYLLIVSLLYDDEVLSSYLLLFKIKCE